MFMEAPAEEVSKCRSRGPKKGELSERTFDYVVASRCLRRKITQMESVEDFESRPRKAVSSVVERNKYIQEWREQKMPKARPGFSGGQLPGRSETDRDNEEEDEEKDDQEREKVG